MRFRLALAALLVGAGVAPADPPKPAAVVQTRPLERLLTEYKEMLRQAGGPVEGDRLVRGFEQDLKDSLGEQGFEGLDINRPVAAYAVAARKKDDELTVEDIRLVLVVPVTGEKEFVGFLGRLKIQAEPVEGKKGVYSLDLGDGPFPNDSHLQFADGGWAYITLNDGDPTDPKELVAAGDLIDDTDPALVSARLYPPRIPAKIASGVFDEIDQAADNMKMFVGIGVEEKHWAKFFTALLEQGPKLLRRYGEAGLKEAAEAGARFTFDRATGDTLTELTLVPKAGTSLAKEIAARGKTGNRVAGVVGKDAAFGVVAKAPLFAAELREIGSALVAAGTEEARNLELPEGLKALADEAGKGLGRAVAAGTLDAAVALNGPDKDGKFTLVVGLSFDDPTAVEKALRAAAKAPGLAKDFQFDAAKVGGVAVHKVPLARLIPEEAKEGFENVFGENPPGYVAFAKDAVFVGFGPGGLDGVRAALEAKPGPAPALELTGNMKKLQKFVAAIDPKAGETFAKYLGADDKPATLLRVTLEGGEKLTARVALNVRYLPKLMLAEALEVVPPPPPNR